MYEGNWQGCRVAVLVRYIEQFGAVEQTFIGERSQGTAPGCIKKIKKDYRDAGNFNVPR